MTDFDTPIRVRGRSIARSYRKLSILGPTRSALPMRSEQQARESPRPNVGARLRAHRPEEYWPIGRRRAPDLSMNRVNQAGCDGPLLLSEPNSKNEAKMTPRRRKWELFTRRSYVAGYGETPLLLTSYVDSWQNGLPEVKRHNSLGIIGLRQTPNFRNCPKPGKT